jgi:hypothetical protein
LLLLPAVGDNAAMQSEPSTAEPPKRKRRWFQFSLRTLMIGVALLAVPLSYVGWEAKVVRERAAFLDHLEKSGAFISDSGGLERDLSQRPSWLRILIGDKDVGYIWLPDESELKRVKELFPEAFITAGGMPPVGAMSRGLRWLAERPILTIRMHLPPAAQSRIMLQRAGRSTPARANANSAAFHLTDVAGEKDDSPIQSLCSTN